MSTFDFKNVQLPALYPLQQSHAVDEIEDELRRLVMLLWDDYLAEQAFDLNVSGMAHLGSFDSVRRAVNQDGLALLPRGGVEASTRYVYRAWKARNHNGRGLHFVRTYLQMLFPNVSSVVQLYINYEGVYPNDCFSILPEERWMYPYISDDNGLRIDGTWNIDTLIDTSKSGAGGGWNFDTSGLILTSRVMVALDFSVDASGLGSLLQLMRSVLPARFVPVFRYVQLIEFDVPIEVDLEIEVEVTTPDIYVLDKGLYVVEDDPDLMWFVGAEEDADSEVENLTGTTLEIEIINNQDNPDGQA